MRADGLNIPVGDQGLRVGSNQDFGVEFGVGVGVDVF